MKHNNSSNTLPFKQIFSDGYNMNNEIPPSKHKFGEIAVSLGLLSETALKESLEYQQKEKEKGNHIRLGDVLIKLGYLKRNDAINIFQQQHIPKSNSSGRFIGQELQGIRLDKFIGKGGMGEVYVGEQMDLGRKIAIKFLSPTLAADSQYVIRFLWEAQASAKLDHHNIVQTYDVGAFENTYYILMQYVQGVPLSKIITQEKILSISKATEIMIQVAEGLNAAHKANIIHRDVKPENIMITPDGTAKVMDFGLARSLERYKCMTATGQVMGTPEYISPEACRGEKVDARGDIYSLGITFYECVTGNPPFYGKSAMAIMLDHISEPPTPPKKFNIEIPNRLSNLILNMISKNPENRYPNLDRMLVDLRKIQDSKYNVENNEYFFDKLEQAQNTKRENKQKIEKSFKIFFALLFFGIILFTWKYFYDSKRDFNDYIKQEEVLSNKERVKLWNDFITKNSDSYYQQEALKRLEKAREHLFYDEIRESAEKFKMPQMALKKLQLYLKVYPSGTFTKQVKQKIEEYKKRIPIIIKINTIPSGASFLVDGKIEGNTPCIASFQYGKKYVLNFYLNGYKPVLKNFSITNSHQKDLTIILKKTK